MPRHCECEASHPAPVMDRDLARAAPHQRIEGIDARTPLHCAGTVAVAALLLDHGARIDARDEDHDLTPAQWRIGESPEVARFLLERGAKADIFRW